MTSKPTTVQVSQNTAMTLRSLKIKMSRTAGYMITIDQVIQNLAQDWEAQNPETQNSQAQK